jgi:hypothetical protein
MTDRQGARRLAHIIQLQDGAANGTSALEDYAAQQPAGVSASATPDHLFGATQTA